MILFLETRINIPFSGNQISFLGACGFGATGRDSWEKLLPTENFDRGDWHFERVGKIGGRSSWRVMQSDSE